MKNLKSIIGGLVIAFVFTSCNNNENDQPDQQLQPVETKKIENLHAPAEGRGNYTGPFTKFSFSEGKQVEGDNWDIAFRATDIIVNGGEKGFLLEDIDRVQDASMVLVESTFAGITEAPVESEFRQDAADALAVTKGSGNGWYTYNFSTHLIGPTPGRILIVKTHDGHYAKVEILNYYKDEDTTSESKYFTFNYTYNPNKGDKALQ